MQEKKIKLGINIEEDLKDKDIIISDIFKNEYTKLQKEIEVYHLPIKEKISRNFIKRIVNLFEESIIERMVSIDKTNGEFFSDMYCKDKEYTEIYEGYITDGTFSAETLSEFLKEEIKSKNIVKMNLDLLEPMRFISSYCTILIKDLVTITSVRTPNFKSFIHIVLNYILTSLNTLVAYTDSCANDNIRLVVEYLVDIAQSVYDSHEFEEEFDINSTDKFIPKNLYNYRDLNKFAEDNGFEKVRNNGDHGIFKRFDGSTVVIPQGRDIGRGLSRTLQKRIVSKEVGTW